MPNLTLDHLLIAVRDLGAASASYRRLLGRAPSWRGRHPTYGTANVLFRLDNCYVELLAPSADAESDSPWLRTLRDHLDARGEGLYGIAIGTDDIDATVSAVRARGLEVSDPADGDGVDLNTGARRAWRNARIPTEATRGVRAFFIEHCSPADALSVAAPEAEEGAFVTGIDHTVVASSDLTDCLRLWQERVGLDLRRTLDSREGRRLHFLRLGDSILELAGAAEPANPSEVDTLWGLAYNVGDVARTVERLRSDGVDVSDPRAGNAPGTIVADLKPGFSHDVRTLLIQKDLS
jgi:catechol 2,3-dioxygenase-like lactoylglutathione lyase family enzyme